MNCKGEMNRINPLVNNQWHTKNSRKYSKGFNHIDYRYIKDCHSESRFERGEESNCLKVHCINYHYPDPSPAARDQDDNKKGK